MSITIVLALVFSGIAAIGSIVAMITIWNNRQRVVVEIRQIQEQTIRVNTINRTHHTIELKEYGLHLSNGKDLSREATFPETMVSFRAVPPSLDFPSTWSISSLKEDIKEKHAGSTVEFAYATDSALEKYRYVGKIPKSIKKLLED